MATTLTAIGSEFQINRDAGGGNGVKGNQSLPQIAALTDGRFVVVYQSDFFGHADVDPIAAVFNADGTVSSLSYLDVFGHGGNQGTPVVAARPNGGFGVAFVNENHADNSPDANGPNITYVPVSATGVVGTPLTVGDFDGATGSALSNPAIATLSGGSQVVAFERTISSTDHDILINVVSADGTATQYSATTLLGIDANSSLQRRPAVAAAGNSALVVFESATSTTPGSANIRAGFLEGGPDFSSLSHAIIADHTAPLFDPAVAAIDEHRYVIVYTDQTDVWARIYDAGALSLEIQLDRPGGVVPSPAVAATAEGGFIATWVDGSGADIHARAFGGAAGGEFTVNALADGAQFDAAVAASGHNLLFGWSDHTARPDDLETPGVRGQAFALAFSALASNPLFDALYYLGINPDVVQAGVNAFEHFNANGWHEGRDPNRFFDASWYLAVNPDVAAAHVNPLDHYHQTGWREGRDPGPSFDTRFYLMQNPDVAAAGIDPLAHFLQSGIDEGRFAHPALGTAVNGFDAEYYLFRNPDVAAAGIDPLTHFNLVGWHEGRNPNGYFDTAGYLSHYTDVAAAGINPLFHFEVVGWKEGRDPSPQFDTHGYLAANPDVAAARINPLDHYLNFGIYEGRTPINDGVWS